MRKFIFLLITVALSGYAFGDTTSSTTTDAKPSKTKKCLFPKSRKRAPDWVCSAKADKLAVAAVGSLAKSGAGIEFMQQMAAADARAQLARKLHQPVQKKIADHKDTANLRADESDSVLISRITDAQLQDTKILKSVYGPRGTLYVLVGIEEAAVQKLHQSIIADYLKQRRKAD